NGDAAGAIAEYREALRLMPASRSAGVRYNLANVLRQTGAAGDSIIEYREAIKLQPNFVDAHLNLGVVLADKGELDAAIGEFQDVLRLQSGHVLAKENLQRITSLRERTSRPAAKQARELATEFISFLREVHSSPDEYDRREAELLADMAALGADAIPVL